MADTTYVDSLTVITADTMNDLNRLHYTILSDPANGTAVSTAIAAARTDTANTFTAAQTATGFLSNTGLIGYTTGAGGTVTQGTDKTTGVTIDEASGQITMNSASLSASTAVAFRVNNSLVAATDVPVAIHGSAGTTGGYIVQATNVAAGRFDVVVKNDTASPLAEAIVINFAVVKGVSS